MKYILLLVLVLTGNNVFAQKAMVCERYVTEGNQKKDQTKFRLTFDPDKSKVEYLKFSGKDWVISSGSVLPTIWVEKEGLRLVAQWTNNNYGKDPAQWSPVIILDIDYAVPNVRAESFGGFADFSAVVSDPWKLECRRID
jgi:hypothetical protein